MAYAHSDSHPLQFLKDFLDNAHGSGVTSKPRGRSAREKAKKYITLDTKLI
jgi:hypothetical protein